MDLQENFAFYMLVLWLFPFSMAAWNSTKHFMHTKNFLFELSEYIGAIAKFCCCFCLSRYFFIIFCHTVFVLACCTWLNTRMALCKEMPDFIRWGTQWPTCILHGMMATQWPKHDSSVKFTISKMNLMIWLDNHSCLHALSVLPTCCVQHIQYAFK